MTHRTMGERSYHGATPRSLTIQYLLNMLILFFCSQSSVESDVVRILDFDSEPSSEDHTRESSRQVCRILGYKYIYIYIYTYILKKIYIYILDRYVGYMYSKLTCRIFILPRHIGYIF